MGDAFRGNEAVQTGGLTRYALGRWYRRIFPGVYVDRRIELTLSERAIAAWLWSKRRAVITGAAAAALHGARWVPGETPIELIWSCTRPPRGIIARSERLGPDEVTELAGVTVATPARTAFDLGRFRARGQAVALLDALRHATNFSVEDVALLAKRYQGARGVLNLKAALPLVDGGAASPKETWLRLVLLEAGLPKPTTQLMVHNGDFYPLAYLDLGWSEFKVAVEYDGDQHRSDRRQYVKDISRLRMLEARGWIVIRVVAEDHPLDVVDRVRQALVSRGWRG